LHHRLKGSSRKNRHDYQRRRIGRLAVAAARVIHTRKDTPNTAPKLLLSRGAGNVYAGESCCTTEDHRLRLRASVAGAFRNFALERSSAERRDSEPPKSVACAPQTDGRTSLSATNCYSGNEWVAAVVRAVAMQQESAGRSPAHARIAFSEHPQSQFLPDGCVPYPDFRRCWQSAGTRHSRWLRCGRGRRLGQPKPREPTLSAAGTEPD